MRKIKTKKSWQINARPFFMHGVPAAIRTPDHLGNCSCVTLPPVSVQSWFAAWTIKYKYLISGIKCYQSRIFSKTADINGIAPLVPVSKEVLFPLLYINQFYIVWHCFIRVVASGSGLSKYTILYPVFWGHRTVWKHFLNKIFLILMTKIFCFHLFMGSGNSCWYYR